MIENYQEEKQLYDELEPPKYQQTATVGAVYSDGLSLIFDGSTVVSTKHYKCNVDANFSAGDRVFIVRDSGTYIVICTIGNPTTT